MIFCLFILVRNECVLRERLKMIDLVFSQDDWLHYCSVKDGISYEYMLYHFWVWPIASMWPKELKDLQ
jgi:hypothetical protein